MEFKTYVLLDDLNSTAPIYQRVNKDQRARITKVPFWDPYLQITFQDKDGKNKTHRYKSNTDEIDQAVQIKNGIPANERYSSTERTDLKFRNGIKVTNKVAAQRYLEAYPGFEGFEGVCDEIPRPQFKLLNKTVEIKTANTEFRKRVQAANRIAEINLEDSQELLIRLNGSFFKPSDDLEENVNTLIEFLDETDENGIEEILKTDMNVDEKTTILLGKLISADMLKFDDATGDISKQTSGGWVSVRNISVTYPLEERKRLFSNFLNTADGSALKNDLEADVKSLKDDEATEGTTTEKRKVQKAK